MTQAASHTHITVLLQETVDALLAHGTSGVFVDATFGRGGHTQLLLNHLDANSHVFAFDKDPDALAYGQAMVQQDPRLKLIHGSFAQLQQKLAEHGINQIDGLMADLGVSSPQLDNANRGFSFMQDGPLDMRMNNSTGLSAAQWLQQVDEETLANVLYQYGEERYSRRLAKAIKQAGYIATTAQLAQLIKDAHPKWEKNKHPATRSFQAIRIAINQELDDIHALLPQCVDMLKPQARMAIISFHSLEDRIVKQFIQTLSTSKTHNDMGLPLDKPQYKVLKKIDRIAPQGQELKDNNRARSAWLRVAEKL